MNSFITLRSTDNKVQATEFKPGRASTEDPFFQSRQIAYDDDRTRAGVVSFEGTRSIDLYPHWELVIVTAGTLTFLFNGVHATISAGGALIINRCARFEITANGPASWVFLSVADDSSGAPEPAVLTFLDSEAALFASPSLDKEILVSPAPTCRNHRMQVRDDIRVRAGVWDSTPYERVLMEQKEHELMHITKGEVTFSDGEGRKEVYGVGETFLVPKGTNGKWTSTVHVAKIYAVVT